MAPTERAAQSPQQTKAAADQLARTAGHVAAIDRVSRMILEDHLESRMRQVATEGLVDEEWQQLKKALDAFIR